MENKEIIIRENKKITCGAKYNVLSILNINKENQERQLVFDNKKVDIINNISLKNKINKVTLCYKNVVIHSIRVNDDFRLPFTNSLEEILIAISISHNNWVQKQLKPGQEFKKLSLNTQFM